MTTSGSDIRPPNAATPYPERPERFNGLSGANGGESAPAPNDAAPSEVEESKGSAPAVPTASQGAEPEISSGGSQAASSSGDDEPAPAKSSGGYTETFTTTSRGTVKRTVRGPQYGDYDTSKPSKKTASEPSLGDGIGAFFKVFFAWISGLINRDMSKFDVLSRVYFPDDPDMQRRKDIMVANRTFSPEAIRQVMDNLPDGQLSRSLLGRMQRDPQVAAFVQKTLDEVEKYNQSAREYNAKNPGSQKVILKANWVVSQFDQESGFNPNARSKDGAIGIAQFLPGTAKPYGLEGSELTDGNKSIEAGVRHMADMSNKYGNQIFALFAYNGGEGSIKHASDSLIKRGTIKSSNEMTMAHLIGFYEGERQKLDAQLAAGQISRAKYDDSWAKQTLDYVDIITGYRKNRDSITLAAAENTDNKSPAPAAPAAPVAEVKVGKL